MNAPTTPRMSLRARVKIFILLLCVALLFIPLVIILLFVFEIEDAIYCKGVVVPEESYEVVSHLDARVMKLNYRTGDEVVEGAVIAELDSLSYENEALEMNSAIEELRAEYELKKAELELLEKEPLPQELWHTDTNYSEAKERLQKSKEKLESFRKLSESFAISKIELDAAELEYIQLEAEFKRSENNHNRVLEGLAESYVNKAKKEIALVEARLKGKMAILEHYNKLIADCKLRAPADGTVVEIPCRNTMYVERGKVAVVLASKGDLMVIAGVDQRFIRKIAIGQEARISSEVFNRLQYGSFTAQVEKIGYIPDMQTGSAMYPVRLRMNSQGRKISIGSLTSVTIITGKRPAIFSLLNINEDKNLDGIPDGTEEAVDHSREVNSL